jgi:peroxiredoxin
LAQAPKQPVDICPILVSETAPNAPLLNAKGETTSLFDIISIKPTVVVFYRGGWCPFCNAQLSDLQTVLSKIDSLGYQVIAISPDSPENLLKSSQKNQLSYEVLSDPGLALASKLGIVFQSPQKYNDMLSSYSDHKNEGLLPVPAVFVLNTQGEVQFEYINPAYNTRLSGALLVEVLKANP